MYKLRELKAMRVRKGLTQADIANAAGVTQQAVSDWESGRRIPGNTSSEVLAKLLGISVDEIMSLVKGDIGKISTCDLCNELICRDGVQEIWVAPYKPFEIINDGKKVQTSIDKGACRIFVVWD